MTEIKARAEGRPATPVTDDLQVVLWTICFGVTVGAGLLGLRAGSVSHTRWLWVFVGGAAVFQFLTFVQPPVVLGATLLFTLLTAVLWAIEPSRAPPLSALRPRAQREFLSRKPPMDRRGYFLCLLVASGCAAALNRYGLGADGGYDSVAAARARGAVEREPRFGVTSYAPEPFCGGSVCWTSRSNPTARQVDEIAEQRDLAAQVREVTPALAAAEARGCSELDPEDRDISPFYHREDLLSVSPVTEKVRTGKGALVRTSGARVKFRGVPGLSIQWLQRDVDCHLLRAAAVDYSMPKGSYCPLMLEGVEVRVFAAGTGLAVEITAEDAGTTEEILRRAYALLESVEPWASVVQP